MSTSKPIPSVLTSNDVHNLHQCIVNTFSNSNEYLNHCCTMNTQPYVSDYVKKRCDELHTTNANTRDLSQKNEIEVYNN